MYILSLTRLYKFIYLDELEEYAEQILYNRFIYHTYVTLLHNVNNNRLIIM